MNVRFTFAVAPEWKPDAIPQAVVGCLPPRTGFTLTYNMAGGYVEENADGITDLEPSYTLTIVGLNGRVSEEIGEQLAKTFGQKEVLVENYPNAVTGLVDKHGNWRLA